MTNMSRQVFGTVEIFSSSLLPVELSPNGRTIDKCTPFLGDLGYIGECDWIQTFDDVEKNRIRKVHTYREIVALPYKKVKIQFLKN